MTANAARYYAVFEKDIAHEIIDGEAIIIHFDTGNYYSLNTAGAMVWSWLDAGASQEEILDAFPGLSPDEIAEIEEFIKGLVSEKILHQVEAPARRDEASLPTKGGGPYLAPRFEKFNDMQQLLLSDPIHEVDEKGWPPAPADPSG
ncbi:MAG: PqqD family protein [Candidatus Methylacidiphilales bacterium]|nr:PqqD family protein [Candidatus Methylacidiphilales bacterium]